MTQLTDKELLELAAKAAGIEHDGCTDWKEPALRVVGERLTYWNPLTDDGDALRLAVAVNLAIYCDDKSADSWCCDYDGRVFPLINHNGDPYAATRRAIVRAAAEIGKAM